MKLNGLEFILVNNALRAALQRQFETPRLIGARGSLAGKRVLEIGCGRGVGMEILLSLGAEHVTGFDLDPKMITLAQKRLAKYGDRTRVFVGDAEAIDAPDASFDAVVDYGVIHHIPGWPQALKEIARVLKPGGMFYFEDLLKGLISTWPAPVFFDHPQATQFHGREFRSQLESAGLSIKKWRQLSEWAIAGRASKSPRPVSSS
ncbi:MAG: class I SAM-dependent methyltransferase [Chloroflexi bacterium]|nr:class I SAM-dependent methyltransferase [Chloroflexota bacterium]MBI3339194.1 class I SAM-dependent methyltransferase [Chloroflexota bacterium]